MKALPPTQAHHDQQIAKEAMKAELAGIRPCPGVL